MPDFTPDVNYVVVEGLQAAEHDDEHPLNAALAVRHSEHMLSDEVQDDLVRGRLPSLYLQER